MNGAGGPGRAYCAFHVTENFCQSASVPPRQGLESSSEQGNLEVDFDGTGGSMGASSLTGGESGIVSG